MPSIMATLLARWWPHPSWTNWSSARFAVHAAHEDPDAAELAPYEDARPVSQDPGKWLPLQWFSSLWHLHEFCFNQGMQLQQQLVCAWPPWLRQWHQTPGPPAPSPGCQMTSPSAQLKRIWTPATGLPIQGSQTSRLHMKTIKTCFV